MSAMGLIAALDRCIRRDPARRGLIGEGDGELCPQHLAAAADHLARRGRAVWILTGFYVPLGIPAAAETDGPPGAAMLAAVLRALGMEVQLLTDTRCLAAVRATAVAYGVPENCVHSCPGDAAGVAEWTAALARDTAELTHVIAIERVGPSHTSRSWSDAGLQSRYQALSPREHWDRCHNMRGEIIDEFTPPLHVVIEWLAREVPAVKSIGIGDGGNEIGMGAVPYADLRRRLIEPAASRIPCRVSTDWTIVAGVSNWGAMALAAAVCVLRQCLTPLVPYDRHQEEQRLQALVSHGPAVDGVTRLQQATVDGLPFLTYLQPWETMRQLLRLDELPATCSSLEGANASD